MSMIDIIGKRYVKAKQILLFIIAFMVSFSALSIAHEKVNHAFSTYSENITRVNMAVNANVKVEAN